MVELFAFPAKIILIKSVADLELKKCPKLKLGPRKCTSEYFMQLLRDSRAELCSPGATMPQAVNSRVQAPKETVNEVTVTKGILHSPFPSK